MSRGNMLAARHTRPRYARGYRGGVGQSCLCHPLPASVERNSARQEVRYRGQKWLLSPACAEVRFASSAYACHIADKNGTAGVTMQRKDDAKKKCFVVKSRAAEWRVRSRQAANRKQQNRVPVGAAGSEIQCEPHTTKMRWLYVWSPEVRSIGRSAKILRCRSVFTACYTQSQTEGLEVDSATNHSPPVRGK